MKTIEFIAIAEATIILILLLLIIFRKIGHPLSEAEVQQKKENRKGICTSWVY